MITTVSSKNQITLPKALLEQVNLKSGDKLLIDPKGKGIFLRPVGASLVENVFASVKVTAKKRNIPFRQVMAETKKLVAKKLVQE